MVFRNSKQKATVKGLREKYGVADGIVTLFDAHTFGQCVITCEEEVNTR